MKMKNKMDPEMQKEMQYLENIEKIAQELDLENTAKFTFEIELNPDFNKIPELIFYQAIIEVIMNITSEINRPIMDYLTLEKHCKIYTTRTYR